MSTPPMPALFYELSVLPEFKDSSLPNSTPEENAIRTVRLLAQKAERIDPLWVPMTQRRPKESDAPNGSVLIYRKIDGKDFLDVIRYDKIYSGITHWQAMPLPPRE